MKFLRRSQLKPAPGLPQPTPRRAPKSSVDKVLDRLEVARNQRIDLERQTVKQILES